MISRKIIYLIAAALIVGLTVVVTVIVDRSWTVGIPTVPSRDVYPIRGIDVSAHNGVIDFEAVAADSIDFVLIKATEGGDFKDRRFHRNIEAARRAGLAVGAYHFFRFDTSGYLQGLNFVNSIAGHQLDLPVVIDLEEYSNPRISSTEMIVRRLRDMIAHLERHGYRVMIYTNKDGYERFVKGRFEGIPLWLATFTPPPSEVTWRLWQYSHRGSVNGIDAKVDMNVFAGSRDAWQQLLENRD